MQPRSRIHSEIRKIPKNVLAFDGVAIPPDALPGDLLGDGKVRVTHFGVVNEEGKFMSTRCMPHDYTKFGSMSLA